MKLYTTALSPYAAKVRIALDEKRLAADEIVIPVRRSGIVSKPPELLAANPRAQVPTLLDGDLVLYDSTVIVEYLDELQPEPPLFPRGARERARARLLEDEGDQLLGGPVVDLLGETFAKPDPGTRDQQKIEVAATSIQAAYDRLEHALDGREFLCGRFGAADIASYIPVALGSFFGVPPTARHPRLAAWRARVAQRPSVARSLSLMAETVQKLED